MVADGHSLPGLTAYMIFNPHGRYLVCSHLKLCQISDGHIITATHSLSRTDNYILIAADALPEFCIGISVFAIFLTIAYKVSCTDDCIMITCHLRLPLVHIIYSLCSKYRVGITVHFQILSRHDAVIYFNRFSAVSYIACIPCQLVIISYDSTVYSLRGRGNTDDHTVICFCTVVVIVGSRRFFITGYGVVMHRTVVHFGAQSFQLRHVHRIGIIRTGRKSCQLAGVFLFRITYRNRTLRRFPCFGGGVGFG